MSRLSRFINDANRIVHMESAYDLRRRLNPHHPREHVKSEEIGKLKHQTAQFQKLKAEFVLHRDELFEEAQGFVEGLKVLRVFEQIINDDVDKILLEE